MKKQLDEVRKLQKIAGILKESVNEQDFNNEEEFDDDELVPINKDELISFIRQYGPKPTGSAPKGEYNVYLKSDYPSIPYSYMIGAMDVFMSVVKACGGKVKLEGQPGPNQVYAVSGCSFDSLQEIWEFLATSETHEEYEKSETIRQANGCAQTWEIEMGFRPVKVFNR
jgi:hypothetical protein